MSSEREVDELALNLGDLTITIRRTQSCDASASTRPSEVSPALGASVGPRAPVGTATRVVQAGHSQVPRSGVWSEAWIEELLEATTADRIVQVDLAPVRHLERRLRSSSGTWTPQARLGRALRAGLSARRKLTGGFFAGTSAPGLPFQNRIYVVLRGIDQSVAGWTEEYSIFTSHCVVPGGQLHPDCVCHGFPSQAEAEAYCIGAGEPWPLQLAMRR